MTTDNTNAKVRRPRRKPLQVRQDAIRDARNALAKRFRAIRNARDTAGSGRVQAAEKNAIAAREAFDASTPEGAAMIAYADKRLKMAREAAGKADATYREALESASVVNGRARIRKAEKALTDWQDAQREKEIKRAEKAAAKRQRKAVESGELLPGATDGERVAVASGDTDLGRLIDAAGGLEALKALLAG